MISARARAEGIKTFAAPMLAINGEMVDVLKRLAPVRIVDQEAGIVEIEVPIPAIGMAPALRALLRIAEFDALWPLTEGRRLVNPRVTHPPISELLAEI